MVRVSLVMAHYKKKEIANESIKSILKTDYPDFELIFCDNCSNDGTADFVRKKYPKIKVIENQANVGSGGAWNSGFRAIDPKSKYVAFVDCDVIFDPKWLSELISIAEQCPDVGGLQPKIMSFWNPSEFEYNGSAGLWMDVYGYALNRGRVFYKVEKDHGQYRTTCETFFVGGSVLFARCNVLRKIGLFDESFFIYHEELDLSWRIRLNGYRLMCVPSSVVWHKGGGKKDETTMFRKYKNNIYMLMKNYELANLSKYVPMRFIFDLVSMTKFGLTPIKAYFWLLRNSKLIWTHRLEAQRVRRRSDSELMQLCVRQPSPVLHYLKGYEKWSEFVKLNPTIYKPYDSMLNKKASVI
jgi:GT2 family glycosyltransferase